MTTVELVEEYDMIIENRSQICVHVKERELFADPLYLDNS